MILACIDIGTNSVKILIADVVDQQIVDSLGYRSVTTRIGQGVEETHRLDPEAMDRTLEVIEEFKQYAESLGAREIIPIATSAVRDAENRDEFVREIMSRTGLKTRVISGDEEAEFTFMGVCSSNPELRSRDLVIVDVGGGSLDFAVAQDGEIRDRFSIDAGFIRLTERFIHSDPVASGELQDAMDYVASLLPGRFIGFHMDEWDLVGVGGTINLLAGILYNKMRIFTRDTADLYFVQRGELNAILRYLSNLKLEDRKKVPGLPLQRADVIVPGAVIFSAIMETLDAKRIIVSNRGMRYGVLVSEGSGRLLS